MAIKGRKGTANYNQFMDGKMHWSQMMSLLLLEKREAVSR